jgi:hypothetical protein
MNLPDNIKYKDRSFGTYIIRNKVTNNISTT